MHQGSNACYLSVFAEVLPGMSVERDGMKVDEGSSQE